MIVMANPADVAMPCSASPLRVSRVHRPVELFRVTSRPFAMTTPDSLVAVPRPVEIKLYVASSLISSVTSPSADEDQAPTVQKDPRQMPLSWFAAIAAAGSDRDVPAPVLGAAQPEARTIKAVDAKVLTIQC